jgi:hypothetical protein
VVSACRSCGAEIWWAETVMGRRMPVDADPVPDGNVVVVREGVGQAPPVVEVGHPATLMPADRPRYQSHFATCPQASQHRKGRT